LKDQFGVKYISLLALFRTTEDPEQVMVSFRLVIHKRCLCKTLLKE
jgi:hypothetical protein